MSSALGTAHGMRLGHSQFPKEKKTKIKRKKKSVFYFEAGLCPALPGAIPKGCSGRVSVCVRAFKKYLLIRALLSPSPHPLPLSLCATAR